jgi:hypothetical protein
MWPHEWTGWQETVCWLLAGVVIFAIANSVIGLMQVFKLGKILDEVESLRQRYHRAHPTAIEHLGEHGHLPGTAGP